MELVARKVGCIHLLYFNKVFRHFIFDLLDESSQVIHQLTLYRMTLLQRVTKVET
jgi:hypothetical protein